MAEARGASPRDWLPLILGTVGGGAAILLLLYPIARMALLAFYTQDFATPTVMNFAAMLGEPMFRSALANTLEVAVCTTMLAVLLALPAAYAVARVQLPLRNLLLTVSVIPLIAPPFIGAYSWIVLLGTRGIVTRYVQMATGWTPPSVYGASGIILALTLSFFPYVFLFVQAALTAADPYLEESAHIMGASRLRILRTVTFPLALPAIAGGALLVFAQSLGNFGVPSILGRDFMVLTTLIVYQVQGTFNVNAAAAVAMVSVMLTTAALLIASRFTKRQRYVTVTSTSRAAVRHVGMGARFAGSLYVWSLFGLALLPQAVVVFDSLAVRWPGTLWPTQYGLANYRFVFGLLLEPMLNSIELSAVATVLCVLCGTLAAYLAARTGRLAARLIDICVMLPFVMPGMITGVAFLLAFNAGPLVLAGTAAILVLAYVVHRLAYVFRAVSAAISQVDRRIDEASTVCGARWGVTMRRITLPLVAPGILAGGILVFSTLIMDLSITILLYAPQWKTLAVTMFEQLSNNRIGYASASGAVAIVTTTTLVFCASRLAGRGMADMFR